MVTAIELSMSLNMKMHIHTSNFIFYNLNICYLQLFLNLHKKFISPKTTNMFCVLEKGILSKISITAFKYKSSSLNKSVTQMIKTEKD